LRRWVAAVLSGVVLGMPVGWLLAHLGLLPFYLGLFFFTLFGLLIGAVVYRVGIPAAPLPRSVLWVGGLVVVAATWTVSIVFEYRHLYPDAIRCVKQAHRKFLPPAQLEAINARTPVRVREYLWREHPPGGLAGYLRWAATSGRMPVGELPSGRVITYVLRQGPIGWSVRVLVSVAMLTFGVLSQVLGLARPIEQPPAAYACNSPPPA